MTSISAMSYFVVAISYPRRINGAGIMEAAGVQAIVDPDISRAEVISRIRSGEYRNIAFIHSISMNDVPQDVTEELQHCAKWGDHDANRLARALFDGDHRADLRKHGETV